MRPLEGQHETWNEEHYKFNTKILVFLEQGIKLISSGSAPAAVPILEKARGELGKRNKLIKLADKAETGWAAVDKYEQDDLASDSDDDKKIWSALERASAKRRKASFSKIG